MLLFLVSSKLSALVFSDLSCSNCHPLRRVIMFSCSFGFVSVLLVNDLWGLLASEAGIWPIWTSRAYIVVIVFFWNWVAFMESCATAFSQLDFLSPCYWRCCGYWKFILYSSSFVNLGGSFILNCACWSRSCSAFDSHWCSWLVHFAQRQNYC